MTFPEVERVFGKAGRANTSTDPAPFSMMETTVILKPESEWREKPRWYSSWAPEWLKAVLRPFWRDRISQEELENEMNAALQLPGHLQRVDHADQGRLDMLSTGIRTPVGHQGHRRGPRDDRARREGDSRRSLQKVPGTRSVFAERVAGGYFLDFVLKREQLARYGLTVDDANMMVMTAVGGDNQSTTVEGRERYGINVRYARDYREDLSALRRVLLPLPGGAGPDPDGGDRGRRARAGPVDDPRRERPARRLRLRGLRHLRSRRRGRTWTEAKKAVARRRSSRPATPWSGAASTRTCCASGSG